MTGFDLGWYATPGVVYMDIEEVMLAFALLILVIVAAYGISIPFLSALGS